MFMSNDMFAMSYLKGENISVLHIVAMPLRENNKTRQKKQLMQFKVIVIGYAID